MIKDFTFGSGATTLDDITSDYIGLPHAQGTVNIQCVIPVGQTLNVEWATDPTGAWVKYKDLDGTTDLELTDTRLGITLLPTPYIRLVPTGTGNFSGKLSFMG